MESWKASYFMELMILAGRYPEPIPGTDKVLVKVGNVGICGSDLQWYSEANIGFARLETPFVLGHEFAGEILTSQRQMRAPRC